MIPAIWVVTGLVFTLVCLVWGAIAIDPGPVRWICYWYAWFTLGRTAKQPGIYINGPKHTLGRNPYGARIITLEDLAYHLQYTARECLPANLVSAVWVRRARDLPLGTIRIVIEMNERVLT